MSKKPIAVLFALLLLGGAVLFAFLLLGVAAPAFAQAIPDDPAVLDQMQKKKDAEELDKRYRSTLRSTKQDTAPVRVDPWQNMRGTDDSKAKR